jgi:hypothetical protein
MINNSSDIENCSALSGQKQTSNQPGRGKWRQCAMLAVVGLAATLLTGCDAGKYTGGGFIQSAAGGNQKATFGFELEGINATGNTNGQVTEVAHPVYDPADPTNILYIVVWFLAKGQCTYNDHAAGVQFHFDCVETTNLPPDGSFPSGVFVVPNADFTAGTAAVFNGPYSSPAGNGTVNVTVTCIGDQYANTNNTLTVQLSGGPYDGYFNSGTIQGGNIQWHPANSK